MMEKENDFEKFEALLQSKSYNELNPQELLIVNKWVQTAQEYEALRVSGKQIAAWFKANPVGVPDKSLLQQLKKSSKVQHQSIQNFWVKPIWSYVATAIVFGVLGWWIGQPQARPDPVTLVERITLRDTIYMTAKADTVYRERIVYRDRPIVLTTQTRQTETKSEKGVSMKEKEELDKLLVSGSR